MILVLSLLLFHRSGKAEANVDSMKFKLMVIAGNNPSTVQKLNGNGLMSDDSRSSSTTSKFSRIVFPELFEDYIHSKTMPLYMRMYRREPFIQVLPTLST
jgi:hypothetical protein